MANELTVINKSDVDLVATQLPQAYQVGMTSHDACLKFGQSLLDRIAREGMSDALDQELSHFITKAKNTVKKINDLRSPATKLFDQFKKVFTTMEGEVDPSKAGSIPYQIQAYRNQYAAQKREEELRRQQEELRRRQVEQALKQYRTDCETEFTEWFNTAVNTRIYHLSTIFGDVTLQNYAKSESDLRCYPVALPSDWFSKYASTVRPSSLLSEDERRDIRNAVYQEMLPRFQQDYGRTLSEVRDDLLTKLPSKRKELEKIAAAAEADAAEAARIKAEMEEKERLEAAAREAERRKQEEEARLAAEAAKVAGTVGGLFDQSAAAGVGYQTKTTVKKKINVLNPEGFLEVIGLWWERVGKNMTVEALSKEFSKQLTFCNKLANDANPVTLASEHVEYVDDVKAR